MNNKKQTRQQIFLDLVAELLKMSRKQQVAIAEEADVCWQTIYTWCWGETINPHFNTVVRVAEAMGYEIKLQREKRHLRKVS